MRRILNIISLIIDLPLAFLIFYSAFLYLEFQIRHPQDDYFELFIAETFYGDNEGPLNDRYDPNPTNVLPLTWEIDEERIVNLDTNHLTISSEVKYFAQVRDVENNYWINTIYVFHDNDEFDTLSNGMGCGTGTFLQKISTDQTIEFDEWNPLLWCPIDYNGLDTENDSLPYFLNEYYGDSVEIYWSLLTYSTPWSGYSPQSVSSPSVIIRTQEVIDNWRSTR